MNPTQFSFDPRFNVGYLRLAEKSTGIETILISDELKIDSTPDGRVYGIELLNATEQLWRAVLSKLRVINETKHATMDQPIIKYFEKDDVMYIRLSEEKEANSFKISPHVTAELNERVN